MLNVDWLVLIKKKENCIANKVAVFENNTSRSRAAVARRAHIRRLADGGSIQFLKTKTLYRELSSDI